MLSHYRYIVLRIDDRRIEYKVVCIHVFFANVKNLLLEYRMNDNIFFVFIIVKDFHRNIYQQQHTLLLK